MIPQFFHTAILFICLAIGILPVSGATVRRLSERDGLPNRQAYAIATDGEGFVWVFTASGLSRFDGTEFRNYRLPDLNRRHDYAPFATNLGTTMDGRLWVSVNSGQLFEYNPRYDRFDLVLDFRHKALDEYLLNVRDDGQRKLLSTTDGVYTLRDTILTRVALEDKNVHDVIRSSTGQWYATTDEGLYLLAAGRDGAVWAASPLEGSRGINFSKMTEIGGRLYAGTFADGIYAVDAARGRVRRLDLPIPALPVTGIVADGDTAMFAAVDGAGVYRISTATGAITGRFHYDPAREQLSANTASDLARGEDGALWISTSSHGINLVTPGEPGVSVVTHDKYNPNSLTADCVNTVFEDRDGDVWYGTDAGLSLRRRDGRWSHFITRVNDIDNNFLTITQAPDGTIYAGGYGSGVWTVDKNTGATRRLPARANGAGVASEYIFKIYCEGTRTWFGGIQGDLSMYDSATGRWLYFPTECVTDMVADGTGTVYIAGCEGLATYRGGDRLEWVREFGDTGIFTVPRNIVLDREGGRLWISTDGQGVMSLDPTTGKAEKYELSDEGNRLDNIAGMVMDRRRTIWVATEHDIFAISPDRRRTSLVTPLLDLGPETSFMPRAMALDAAGNLLMGTTDGAVTFDTDRDFAQHGRLRLLLTDLTVNGHRVEPAEDNPVLTESPDRLQRLTLEHGDNSFSLHVSALGFDNTRRMEIWWRMAGEEGEWRPTGPSRDISCRDLPHGTYRLEVRATDLLTGDTVAQRTLEICVRPPLWLTWWAKLLYLLAGVGIAVALVHATRVRQRERRIADKIQSFLNMAHDLRTPVTLIKAPLSELENREDLPEDARKDVRLAMNNVECLLTMISRLLDLRRESRHSDCLNLSETDLREFLETKVAEFRMAALQKGLSLTVDVPDDMPRLSIDRNKLSHILDNLLSNAIKYTFNGSVTVSAAFDRKQWTLCVSDTGIGIPRKDRGRLFRNQYRGANAVSTEEIGSGMGLLIVHRLVALHKGAITVTSSENEGTTFTLTFPRTITAAARHLPAQPQEEHVGQPADSCTAPEALNPDKDTLMLIDDEKDILDYLAGALSGAYNIVCYADAADALRDIGRVNPDIVVSDVRLKGMSGFELCQQLKSNIETSHIPVILLSALSERQNMILGLEAGANDYIVKPFDISVLRLRIRNILLNRRQIQTSVVTDRPDEDGDNMIGGLDKEFLHKVTEAIDSNLDNSEFSIPDLCASVGMSRTAVYNKIKALTGESINDYIKIRRLNKAREMLSQGGRTIGEVAYMVGFSDPKYFSTCFKKQFGVSPSKL